MIKQEIINYIISAGSDSPLYLTTNDFDKRNASSVLFRHSKNLAFRFVDIADALKKHRELTRREDLLLEYNMTNLDIHIIEECTNFWYVIRVDDSKGRKGFYRKDFYSVNEDSHQGNIVTNIGMSTLFNTKEDANDTMDILKGYAKDTDIVFHVCVYEYNIYREIK